MSNVSLYHGDCLELLKDVPSKSVNMVLCDLPYGTTRNKWDSCINLDALWIEYKRVLAEGGGAVALFAQMPFVATLYNSNPKWFRYEYVWVKSCPVGFLNANRMPLRAHEQILIFYPKLPTYNKQRRMGFSNYIRPNYMGSDNYNYFKPHVSCVTDGTRDPIDVLNFKVERGKHPTQKPVLLLEWLIKTYTNEGDTVLDNTMGSGSTGVACVNTGRNFIGMELNADYFATAQARIKEAQGALICY